MVEVIDKGRNTDAHPVPLLFVHGAWHGAWCWDAHFLDHFADRGYRAIAVNLRAHGGRSSSKALHRHSIADYLDDVTGAADALPTPPVMIGHSLGGFLVQKYLETRDVPAGVLVASAPPTGVVPFLGRWIKQHPLLFAPAFATMNTTRLLSTPGLIREKFFSVHTSEADIARFGPQLQNESMGIIPGMVARLPKPDRVSTPLLVLGAELDDCFTQREVHATAEAYRTQPKMFLGMGHDMMLEPGWEQVADYIDDWLVTRGL
jgi:pimeloyl-ACP methyl ester carboxylesterase